MHFLLSDPYCKFSFGETNQNPFVFLVKNYTLSKFFSAYTKEYKVQNDLIIFDVSLFNAMASCFEIAKFNYKNAPFADFISFFEEQIYKKRRAFYSEKSNAEIESLYLSYQHLNLSNQISSFDKTDFLTTIDLDGVEAKVNTFIKQNSYFLENFKDFLLGFYPYIISKNYMDYKKFNYVYNILFDDMKFFRKTELKSLLKYDLSIGFVSSKSFEVQRKIASFIAAGTCTYGKEIFINSNLISSDKLWIKKTLKNTFYHEIGHALDYLYFDETILKNKLALQKSSHNFDFLNIVEKNFKDLKRLGIRNLLFILQ